MDRIVYTGGTFDCFHAGHVNFLKQCSIIGDRVIVSLNRDEFIEKYKSKPPIMSYAERYDILNACRYVDYVIPNTGDEDSKPAISKVREMFPNSQMFIVVGSDWAKKDYYKQMQFTTEWLNSLNIVLIYVPYTEGVSTTEIKARIKDDKPKNNRT